MSALKFTLFRPLKNIVMYLMLLKQRFGKGRYIKQINDIWKWQKKMAEFHCLAGKDHARKEFGVIMQEKREVEVGTLLLGSHKDNVIAYIALSSFWCLSFKFEVYIARFGTKY